MAVKYADVEPGTQIAPKSYRVTRLDLVKYAGASGDFNPIHWSERIARSVGLPGAIVYMPCAMTPGRPTERAIRSLQWMGLKSPDAPAYFTRSRRVTR